MSNSLQKLDYVARFRRYDIIMLYLATRIEYRQQVLHGDSYLITLWPEKNVFVNIIIDSGYNLTIFHKKK